MLCLDHPALPLTQGHPLPRCTTRSQTHRPPVPRGHPNRNPSEINNIARHPYRLASQHRPRDAAVLVGVAAPSPRLLRARLSSPRAPPARPDGLGDPVSSGPGRRGARGRGGGGAPGAEGKAPHQDWGPQHPGDRGARGRRPRGLRLRRPRPITGCSPRRRPRAPRRRPWARSRSSSRLRTPAGCCRAPRARCPPLAAPWRAPRP